MMKRVLMLLLSAVMILNTIPMNVCATELNIVFGNEILVESSVDTVSGNEIGSDVSDGDEESEEIITTGKVGTHSGFEWSYNSKTKILTVTGEDSRLDEWMYSYNTSLLSICSDVQSIVFQECKLSGKTYALFSGFKNLKSIDLKGLDTSNVTDMSAMFSDCSNLESIDVSGCDTSNVTDFSAMFSGCASLENLDVSKFDTSNAKKMSSMFNGCVGLKDLDVSGFDTSNATDISCMFRGCSNLKNIDVSGFNTSNVTGMMSMFKDCTSIERLDLSSFDTTKCTNFDMFEGCTNLKYLDLSSFDTSKVNCSVTDILSDCSNLEVFITPEAMTVYQKINLPATFYDSQSNAVTQVSLDTCKTTLTRIIPEFNITYELNGGMQDKNNPQTYTKFEQDVTLTAATREGYQFEGWDSDAEFTDKVESIPAGTTGDIVLYAKWTANKYIIAFEGNGATDGVMSNMDCEYDREYSLTANVFARDNYTFTGWNTAADGSGTAYEDAAGIFNLIDGNNDTVTLYAQWKYVEYTITYELNGGTNADSNPSGYGTESDAIILAEPTRAGYAFAGWYTSKNYKTKVTEIPQGSTGDKIFYAKWTVGKYTISFDGNGATSGKMKNLTNRSYGSNYTLSANAFKRIGYTFCGWNTEADGSGVVYKNKAKVKNLTDVHGKTITLYAQWSLNEYKITYKLNGGINSDNNPDSYNVTSDVILLDKPVKAGYTFGGWYTNSSYKAKNKVEEIATGSSGNKTLYARWIPNKYTIEFDENGATSGTVKALTNRAYGTFYTLSTNKFKRTGYTFVGWNTKADGSGTVYRNKEKVKNLAVKDGVTVTLYAQWKLNEYKINYKLNGGTAIKSNPAVYNVNSATITLTTPVKSGYTFGGWYTSSSYKAKYQIEKIVKGSTGNKTLYAKWTINKYDIEFDGNGATSGSMKTLTNRAYGKSYALSENKFKRASYIFTGWNTEADGSGTAYTNKAKVKNLALKNGETVTLYAQWEKITITPSDKTITINQGDSITVKTSQWVYSYNLFQNGKLYQGRTWTSEREDIHTEFEVSGLPKGTYTIYYHCCSVKSSSKKVYVDGQFVYRRYYSPSMSNTSDYTCKIIVK